ncbi:hypothetical protein K1W69_05995 [Hoeflea sp. WL0058]|uniref:Uncharacterized protein n=1 Tax=Flavimaribacter sediminis TaxID=2865987 RepID=A0AAE2ZLM3_9HYPH|nr:hypothetical protein [Flavimaribacter sediminis]MBW8636730.1 hypothetical protein [Flavimaribacter sediminis]
MTCHTYNKNQMSDSTAYPLHLAFPAEENTLQTRQAETLGDFMKVTRLMKRANRRYSSPVDQNRIGRTLSLLRHGGGGPDTGYVVLATYAGEPVGFALSLSRQGKDPGVVWLHTEDTQYRDQVTKALIAGMDRLRAEWEARNEPPVRVCA